MKDKTRLVNEVIGLIETHDVTETNKLIKCGAQVITQILGVKEIKKKTQEEPFWKRRIEGKIKALRKDVSLVERWQEKNLRKVRHKERLEYLYHVKGKGFK